MTLCLAMHPCPQCPNGAHLCHQPQHHRGEHTSMAQCPGNSWPNPAAPDINPAWETWGIAARWNPQHQWHAPDEGP